MSTKALGILICALCAALMSGPAAAQSYNGNWPLTISHSQFSNGSYCLTLNGSNSGGASLTGPLGNLPNGDFQVVGRNLVASIAQPYGGGFNAGLVFVLPARNGNLAKGAYIDDNDGYLYDTSTVTVGTKNGC
jgi:hypothetical protein